MEQRGEGGKTHMLTHIHCRVTADDSRLSIRPLTPAYGVWRRARMCAAPGVVDEAAGSACAIMCASCD